MEKSVFCIASVASGWPEVTAGLLTKQLHTWGEQDTLEAQEGNSGTPKKKLGPHKGKVDTHTSFTVYDPQDTGDLQKELELCVVSQSTYLAQNTHILQMKKEFAVDYSKL